MKAPDTHSLLLTCQNPLRALSEFADAVARGGVRGTATVVYQETGHRGENARLKPYWHRIVIEAQLAAVWTFGRADLPDRGNDKGVSLSEIVFDADEVQKFVEARQPPRSTRGRKRDPDQWTPLWISALQLAKAGKLNVGHFPTQKALIARLDTMMGGTLGDQTIKPFVSHIYKEIAEKTPQQMIEFVEEFE